MSTKALRLLFACIVGALLGVPALGASALDAISSKDRIGALRAALNQSTAAAVGRLGVAGGFLGNPRVRIPLPGKLAKAEKTLRMLGLGQQVEQLTTAMNGAAEAAVGVGKDIFVNAVQHLTVEDAMAILRGPDDAATQYFKRTTAAVLASRFLPIVSKATARVDLANRYNAVAGRAGQLGLVDAADASIEGYVTRKALDGLFLMMAEEEAAIRRNPAGQASKLLQRVFGKLGN